MPVAGEPEKAGLPHLAGTSHRESSIRRSPKSRHSCRGEIGRIQDFSGSGIRPQDANVQPPMGPIRGIKPQGISLSLVAEDYSSGSESVILAEQFKLCLEGQ